jgi:hypothetical protein
MHIIAQWCFGDEFFFAIFGLFEEKFGKMAHCSFFCVMNFCLLPILHKSLHTVEPVYINIA